MSSSSIKIATRKLFTSEHPSFWAKSITRPMPHCKIKIPIKNNKLCDVKALPARCDGKERPIAGWVSANTTQHRQYRVHKFAPAAGPIIIIIANEINVKGIPIFNRRLASYPSFKS